VLLTCKRWRSFCRRAGVSIRDLPEGDSRVARVDLPTQYAHSLSVRAKLTGSDHCWNLRSLRHLVGCPQHTHIGSSWRLIRSIGTRSVDSGGGSWRIVIALGWLWALVLGVGILFMPESPRWLMAHEKYDEARLSIAKVSFGQVPCAIRSHSGPRCRHRPRLSDVRLRRDCRGLQEGGSGG